jgi:PAS domain S-box-containing protein
MGEEVAVNSLRNGAADYVLKSQLSNLVPAVERALHLSAEKDKQKQPEPERPESGQQFRRLAGLMGEKEASIAAMLKASMDGIMRLDHDSKIIEWNPAAERIFGYTRTEALSRNLDSLIAPTASPGKHSFSLANFLLTDPGNLSGCPIGLAARRANGEEFPAVLTIVREASRESPVFTCFIHDLAWPPQAEMLGPGGGRSHESPGRQTAEADQRTQERVIELHLAYETVELFASTLSSEMQAPLTHFESLLAVLQNDVERLVDERSRPYLQAICKSLCQAGRMIGGLLAFSPRSRIELHNVRVNLVEVIKDMLHDMWSELENRQTAIDRFERPNHNDDPSLLRHALHNIIAHCAPQPTGSS